MRKTKAFATLALTAGVGFGTLFGFAGCSTNQQTSTEGAIPPTNQSQVDENSQNIQDILKDIEELKNQLNLSQNEIENLKNQLNDAKENYNTLAQNYSKIVAELGSISETISKIKTAVEINGEDISTMQGEILGLSGSISEVKEELKNLGVNDNSAIVDSLNSMAQYVYKLQIRSAIQNTFGANYVSGNITYNGNDYSVYSAPDGRFALANHRSGTFVRYDGLNFANLPNKKDISKAEITLQNYIADAFENADVISVDGTTYSLTSDDETLSAKVEINNNFIKNIDYKDSYTTVKTDYYGINSIAENDFEIEYKSCIAINPTVRAYIDINEGIDNWSANNFCDVNATAEVTNSDGTTSYNEGRMAYSSNTVAEKLTLDGGLQVYATGNKNGTEYVQVYASGETGDSDDSYEVYNKKVMTESLKISIFDGVNAISTTDSGYRITAGNGTVVDVVLDEDQVSELSVYYNEGSSTVEQHYTLSTLTKEEYKEFYYQVQSVIDQYKTELSI